MRYTRIIGISIAMLALLSACQSQPGGSKGLPGTKIGKPYVVEGTTYYPEYDATYDRVGDASWYGPGFHGKYTANGEVYNQEDLTAAHPTLPMPSLVRVTNLANGKSLIVRVNDRGPFKKSRIIDLSKASAQRLGISSTQKVRVQFLKFETEQYIAEAQRNGQIMSMVEYNANPPSARIVESMVASSNTGSAVADAAPIMTVSSEDTYVAPEEPQPAGGPPITASNVPNILGQPAPAPASADVPPGIQQAWADDNVTLPDPQTSPPPAATKTVIVEEAAPAVAPPPQRIVYTPTPAATSGSGYIIQAGSFASEENARKLAAKLNSMGKVTAAKVETGGKTWWRVWVGPFASRNDAESNLQQVRTLGVPDARITR